MHIEQKDEISLWWAWLIWLCAMVVGYGFLLASFAYMRYLGWEHSETMWGVFAAHSVINVILGICLTRYYLPRLGIDWHPMHSTIGEIAAAKLSGIFFWWISWPVTFIKLAFVKI